MISLNITTLHLFCLQITYGIKIRLTDDPFVKNAEEALEIGSNAANPGTFLVDTLPICA